MLLPRPLLLLTWLRLRGKWRVLRASLRTPKGIALTAAATLLVLMGFAPLLLAAVVGSSQPSSNRESMPLLGPLAILGVALLSFLRSSNDHALAFLQAEVDLLFAAPFSRAQLLLYKLAQRLLPLLFVTLLMGVWLRPVGHSWLAVFLGLHLTLWFLHLFGLCMALTGQLLEARRFAILRRVVLVAIVGTAIAGAWWVSRTPATDDALGLVHRFAGSTLGQILTLPTTPFALAITAPRLWPDFVGWGAVAFAINLVLLVLAIRINANWLESSAESSRKLAVRLDEFRRTGGMSSGDSFRRLRLPMLPRWGGIGPLAWRQLLSGGRQGLRGLLVIAFIVAILGLPQLLSAERESWVKGFRPTSVFLLVYVSLFLPQMLRLDFRGDIDRLDTLKALPTSPWTVAFGQVLAPAVLVTVVQAPLGLLMNHLMEWHLPAAIGWVPALFLVNLLIASLENAFFLYWPTRPSRGAGMQFAASQMLSQFGKMMVLAILVGIAAGAGALATLPFDDHYVRSLAAASVVTAGLGLEVAAVIAIMARLFARFDPSAEQVPDA